MANNFTAYENFQRNFNNRYKVNFSFEQYEAQKLNKKNIEPALKGQKNVGKENLKYRNALLKIYKDCVQNMKDNKYKSFNPSELATDFEKLMNHYRDYCNKNDKQAPDVNGGWDGIETMDSMRATLSTIKPEKIKDTTNRYISGNLRLRDIRAKVRNLTANGISSVSAEGLAEIMTYRESIQTAVENRPTWWKIIHPFKNNAEQKAVEALDTIIDFNLENVLTAQDIIDGEVIGNAKMALDRASNNIEEIVENRGPKKERMNMDFMSEKNNIVSKGERVVDDRSLKKDNIKQM